jgi:hypothetical protein
VTPRARLSLALLLFACACSTPPSDSRYVPASLPDQTTFAPVASLLTLRCGSIDCHGAPARNLRLFGSAGLRASAGDRPFIPVCDTPDEIDLDYQGVVGLEPERMSAVVADHGANPDRLSMVAKARGDEMHKGGQMWRAGDDSDTCLLSWLSGAPNAASCTSAVTALLPGGAMDPYAQCLAH